MRRPSDRAFALTFACVFALLAALRWAFAGSVSRRLLGAAVLFAVVGAVKPGLFMPLNRAWFQVSRRLAALTNGLLLGILFYLVVLPLGLVLRLRRNGPIDGRAASGADSYWKPVAARQGGDHYRDLF